MEQVLMVIVSILGTAMVFMVYLLQKGKKDAEKARQEGVALIMAEIRKKVADIDQNTEGVFEKIQEKKVETEEKGKNVAAKTLERVETEGKVQGKTDQNDLDNVKRRKEILKKEVKNAELEAKIRKIQLEAGIDSDAEPLESPKTWWEKHLGLLILLGFLSVFLIILWFVSPTSKPSKANPAKQLSQVIISNDK